jgi:hypothetical protein
MPYPSKAGEQQRAGYYRHDEEAPRGAAGNHHQWIDSRRWMKGAGELHRRGGKRDADGRHPDLGPQQVQHSQSDRCRYEMPPDQRARLRRPCLG